MKFKDSKKISLFLICFIILINITFSENIENKLFTEEEFSFENMEKFETEKLKFKSNSRNKVLLLKCQEGTITDKALCENLNILANKSKSKTMYRVEAIMVEKDANNTKKSGKSEIFNIAIPINTCKNEDCEFCCLSNNRCGTKRQCENSLYYRKYLNGFFIFLITLLTTVFIIKCFQVDSYPDQDKDDKLKAEQLSDLISLYGITKNNRSKFIK